MISFHILFFLIRFILSKILFYFQEHAKAVNTNKNFELSPFPITHLDIGHSVFDIGYSNFSILPLRFT
jgi:hypothetical protein